MRILSIVLASSLALIFATPMLHAQALAEKALTTAATPAPTLTMPQVGLPRATMPSTTVHHSTRYRAPTHPATHRGTARTAHKNSHITGSNPSHVTYRRVQ